MPIYNRARPGEKKKNFWISYTIAEEQRLRYGIGSRTVRESADTGDRRMAEAVERARRQEVLADTWAPKGVVVASRATVRTYGEKWIAKRRADGVRDVRTEAGLLRTHVFPRIGDKTMVEVRRQDVAALIMELQGVVSKKTGKRLAPRTVHAIYRALYGMFQDAVEVDEILVKSPCVLKEKRGELPTKKDADPRFRRAAIFTREEAERIMSDERIPAARRVLYAMLFFSGVRIGEAIGRQWRDYDSEATPLGMLAVVTQYEEEEVKTEMPREVPVHQAFAAVLATWRISGWPRVYGRLPTPDDFIVPKQIPLQDGSFTHLGYRRTYHNLHDDLARIGLRARRLHDTRRTFVTLARADGARPDLLRFVTHGRSGSMQDLYTTPPWETLCEQVSCLRLQLRSEAQVYDITRRGRPPLPKS
jgi:integrase